MPPIYINGQEVVKRYVGIQEVVAAYVGSQQVYLSDPYAAMSNPAMPLPSFIEGWALNSWNGVNNDAPSAAGIPTDSMGCLQLEYTVSGASGASSLTISAGDISKGSGYWGGVIKHDDGTYGLYTISAISAGSCTVFPPLRATVTSKTLRNTGSSVNGQHFTEPAYRALARKVFLTTKSSGYRLRKAAGWDALTGVKDDWGRVGSLGYGQYNIAISNNFIGTGTPSYRSFISRGRRYLESSPTPGNANGAGVTKTFALGGGDGFLEAFISRGAANTTGVGFAPFRVQVVVDSVTLLDQTYTANAGLQRIVVPYTNGSSGTLTITCTSNEATYYHLNVGEVVWWKYDRTPVGWAWSDSVIDKNAKTVVIGDSWTTYYPDGGSGVDGVFGVELQAAMTEAGGSGSVVSVGNGGTTAEWGLANFDALVAPESPAQVVILFFTNDQNSISLARWLDALYKIGLKCQALGARPIFIMPLPTQSIGQSIEHGKWAEELGSGLQA